MNLYLISQTERQGYDTYNSAVVAARNEDEARNIHPREGLDTPWEKSWYGDWCSSPEQVKVEYIGRAGPTIKKGIICASFNAG